MHFTDPSVGLLGANAIVAAGVPHAAGVALAAQMQKSDRLALSFFGEGAVNQGVFHDTPISEAGFVGLGIGVCRGGTRLET